MTIDRDMWGKSISIHTDIGDGLFNILELQKVMFHHTSQ